MQKLIISGEGDRTGNQGKFLLYLFLFFKFHNENIFIYYLCKLIL